MAGCFDLAAHGGRIIFVGLFQGEVTFNDPHFHRRELTLLASRNALPCTFRDVIRLVEGGQIDTRPWVTHRFSLADTPTAFPRDIAGNPAVLKAMIEVGG
jgi:threonine dehydrogenase-like Zn-dependent dehydrogenase